MYTAQTHLKLRSFCLPPPSSKITDQQTHIDTHTLFPYLDKLATTTLVIIKLGTTPWYSIKFPKPQTVEQKSWSPLSTTSHWVTQRTEPYTKVLETFRLPSKDTNDTQTTESVIRSTTQWPCQSSGRFPNTYTKSGAQRELGPTTWQPYAITYNTAFPRRGNV